MTAVAAGSRAITTAPWLAGAVVSAYDVSSGNPATTPPATTASRAHWRRAGRRCRVSRQRGGGEERRRSTARPEPMNSGDRPPTATRVNGTVNENAATPSEPHQSPARDGG